MCGRSSTGLMCLLVLFIVLLPGSEAFSGVVAVGGGGEPAWQSSCTPGHYNPFNPWCNSTVVPVKKSNRVRKGVHSRAAKDDPTLICGRNALCGALEGDFEYVYGQVGLYYYNADLEKNVFITLYVKDAVLADGRYAIPEWDGKGFFIHVGADSPPLWIQPMFMDVDTESCPDCREFMSHGILYKKNGEDYSDYPYGAALSYMYLTVDANNQVIDYSLDVYDEDDEFSEEYVTLEIGDEIQMLYMENDSDESSEWNRVTLEEPLRVTQAPRFEYAGYIPGRDYECTSCDKVNLPETDVFFRIEGWESDYTDLPERSVLAPLGKLKDNVSTSDSGTGTPDDDAGTGETDNDGGGGGSGGSCFLRSLCNGR